MGPDGLNKRYSVPVQNYLQFYESSAASEPGTNLSSFNTNRKMQNMTSERNESPIVGLVQNAFGPLGEWVGLSMGVNGDP